MGTSSLPLIGETYTTVVSSCDQVWQFSFHVCIFDVEDRAPLSKSATRKSYLLRQSLAEPALTSLPEDAKTGVASLEYCRVMYSACLCTRTHTLPTQSSSWQKPGHFLCCRWAKGVLVRALDVRCSCDNGTETNHDSVPTESGLRSCSKGKSDVFPC